jgi:hypothetical protein
MTFDPTATAEQRMAAIREMAQALAADKAPIVLGPFRSELGFEASYFQPFIAWLASQVKDFATRAVVVTRGGLAPLYGSTVPTVDLYQLRTVTEIRRENLYDYKQLKLQKQTRQTDWDTRVIEDAARLLNLGPTYHTVHPAWMYWGLAPYWEETQGLRYLQKFTHYAPIPKLAKYPGSEQLPPGYVAVKFYGRATLPYPDPDVERFIQRTVATIAAQAPVVILASASEYDDHADIPIEGPNVFTLGRDCPPEQNLLVQASVLAHAKAFVGTYGGMAQLAVRMGVPSVSVWKEFGGTAHAHLSLQSWISKATRVPFVTGSIEDAGLWQGVLSIPGQVEMRQEQVA